VAIPAVVAASSFGITNDAYAGNLEVTANIGQVDLDGNGNTASPLSADAATDTLSFASAATALIAHLKDGDFSLASITADTAADATITISDDSTASILTINGITQSDGAGDLIIVGIDKATVIDIGGNVTNSSGAGVIKFQMNATDHVLMTAASKTLGASIDGVAADEGNLQITGDSTVVTGIMGGTNRLLDIDIDDKVTFQAAVRTKTLDIDEIAIFNDTLNVSTTSNFSASAIALNGATTLTGIATVANGITVTASNDLTLGVGGALLDHAAATLSFTNSAAKTVSGIIGGATAAGTKGLLKITNTAVLTFADALGGANAAAQLKEIDIDNNGSATFSSTVDAALITVEGTAIFTGVATGTTIDLNGGDATFTAQLVETISGASTLNLDATSKATFNFGHATSGSSNIVDTITTASGSEIRLTNSITNGMTVFKTTNQDATVHLESKIYMPSNLVGGQTLVMVTDTDDGGDVDTRFNSAMQDTALTDYVADEASQVVTVTSVNKTAAAAGVELGVNTDMARALLQARNSVVVTDSTAETAFYNALNQEGGLDADADTALAQQVAPQSDTISGSAVATRAMTGTVQGIVSNRMASLRSGDAYVTGMSAGNGMSANSGFIQAFGSQAEQKNTGSSTNKVFGFDSETSGLAIGFDGVTDSGSTLGLSASYSTTDVDGKGFGKSKNSIDSYTVSVYADKATDMGYVEGSLTYGINDNSNSRLINVAGLDRTYKGNYDSQQMSLKVGGGVPNEVADGAYITPFANATATVITTDAYTETSTTADDGLRLKVAQDDINSVVGTLGVKAHMVTDKGTPMISLAVNNEFGDTSINSSNTFQGGGTAFKTTSEVEELSATLGLGYSFGNDVTSLNINY
jgi:uncharacterized protein with beta-barrel porin domain